MNKNVIICIFLFLSAGILFGQKIPTDKKVYFSKEALEEKVKDTKGNNISIEEVINTYKGKVIVLKFWANWCKDCLVSMPQSEKLREDNPEISFIYFSLDRSEEVWKKGIIKYGLNPIDNYWFSQGWENTFNNYIDLNWIPRYIVINQKGNIAEYYITSIEGDKIQEIISKLLEANKSDVIL